jgi:hypothetical protein
MKPALLAGEMTGYTICLLRYPVGPEMAVPPPTGIAMTPPMRGQCARYLANTVRPYVGAFARRCSPKNVKTRLHASSLAVWLYPKPVMRSRDWAGSLFTKLCPTPG